MFPEKTSQNNSYNYLYFSVHSRIRRIHENGGRAGEPGIEHEEAF